MKILTITQLGTLLEYEIVPRAPSQPGIVNLRLNDSFVESEKSSDVDPKTLVVDAEPTFCWDTCRKSSWPQSLIRLKSRRVINCPIICQKLILNNLPLTFYQPIPNEDKSTGEESEPR